MLALFKILLVNPLFELFRSSNLGREQIHGDETRGVFVFHDVWPAKNNRAAVIWRFQTFAFRPDPLSPSLPAQAPVEKKVWTFAVAIFF